MTDRYIGFRKIDIVGVSAADATGSVPERTPEEFIMDEMPNKVLPGQSPIHYVDATSEDVTTDLGFIYPTTSAQRLKRNRLGGPVGVGGEIQIPLYTKGTPTLIHYAMGGADLGGRNAHRTRYSGQDDTGFTGPTGQQSRTVWTHEFKIGADIPTFLCWIGKDKKEHRFIGGSMKSMTVDIDPGEPTLCSFDTMFREEMPRGDLATVTWPDYNVLERCASGAELNNTEVAGNAVDYIESGSIELTNTVVEDNYVIGSRYIPEKFVQEAEVTGSLTMNFANIVRYQDFITEKEPSIEFGQTRTIADDLTTHAVDERGESRSWSFFLPKVSFNTGNLPTEGSDRYVFETEYMSERDTDGDILIFNCSNEENKKEIEV